jgi:phosphate transport system substrate-binding protein
MNKLMQHWTEGFRGLYPNVVAEVEGTGSATAMPALVAGTANFGPMSRDPKEKEISDFEAAFGYPPTLAPTAVDILAVYVHRDNPIQGLTFQQLDAIFSSTRKGGAEKQVRTWGDLGLTGEWADKPISCYGRTAASGTYGYFKERALFGGDFHDGVKEQPGNASIIQGVGGDRYGIGYSAMGYRTPDVKAVPLALEVGGEFVPPEPARALAGDYPLARYLWMAVNYKPGTELDPLRREFLMYVFSREGQQVVVKDGYLPLPAPIIEESLAKFGLKR